MFKKIIAFFKRLFGKPVKVEVKKPLARMRIYPGQRTWKLDLSSGRIDQVYFSSKKREIVMEDFCIYCTAINKYNAMVKFNKQLEKMKVLN